jgi:threonine/homoserine/homoserine lactone efflux protein
MVQLANPKTATLLIAFYPQFVPHDRPMLATTAVLAFEQVAIELTSYLAVAIVATRAGDWFRRPAIRRRLEAVSGTVLVALGVRVAAMHR